MGYVAASRDHFHLVYPATRGGLRKDAPPATGFDAKEYIYIHITITYTQYYKIAARKVMESTLSTEGVHYYYNLSAKMV